VNQGEEGTRTQKPVVKDVFWKKKSQCVFLRGGEGRTDPRLAYASAVKKTCGGGKVVTLTGVAL